MIITITPQKIVIIIMAITTTATTTTIIIVLCLDIIVSKSYTLNYVIINYF